MSNSEEKADDDEFYHIEQLDDIREINFAHDTMKNSNKLKGLLQDMAHNVNLVQQGVVALSGITKKNNTMRPTFKQLVQ